MAKNSVSILCVLITITWLMVTAQAKQPATILANRQSRHIFLFPQATSANDVPSIDFEYSLYNYPMNIPTEKYFTIEGSEPRIPNRISRPVTSTFSSSGESSSSSFGERTFQTFANLFASRQLCPSCPSCPACPSLTCPVCQACPTCPVAPVIPEKPITVAPAVEECTNITSTASIAPCSRVSAAPKGTINVTFSDTTKLQITAIGIVAVAPNTQIQLICTVIPTVGNSAGAKTQVGAITADVPITSTGFLQIIALGSANSTTAAKLTCSWISS